MSSQKRASVFLFLKYGLFSFVCFALGTFWAVALQDAGIFAGTTDAAINFVRVPWDIRLLIQVGLTTLIVSALGLGVISLLNRSEKAPLAILQALALVPLIVGSGFAFWMMINRQWDMRVTVALLMSFALGGVVLFWTHQIKREKQGKKVVIASLGIYVAVMIGALVAVQPKRIPLSEYHSSVHNKSAKILESVLDDAQAQAVIKALDNRYIKHWVKGKTPWILIDEAYSHAISYEYRDGYWRLHAKVNFSQKDALDLKCAVSASRAGSMWNASGAFERGEVTCRNNAMSFKTDLDGKLTYAANKYLNREVVDGWPLFFKSAQQEAKKQLLADAAFLKWAGSVGDVAVAKKAFYLSQFSRHRFRPDGSLASLDVKTNTRDLRCLVGQDGAFKTVAKKLTWVNHPIVWCVDRTSGQTWQRRGTSIERGHMLNTQNLPQDWLVEVARAKLVKASGLKKIIKGEYADKIKLLNVEDFRGAASHKWAFHRVMTVSDTQTVQMVLFGVWVEHPLMCAVFVPQKGKLPDRVRMLGSKNNRSTMTTCWSATHQHQFFEDGTLYRSLLIENLREVQPIISIQNMKN